MKLYNYAVHYIWVHKYLLISVMYSMLYGGMMGKMEAPGSPD